MTCSKASRFLTGITIPFFFNSALWASTQVIAVTGQAIPGTSSVFSKFVSVPLLNDRGQIGFWDDNFAGFGVLDNGRVFLADNGSIVQVAAAGQFAPDGTVVHSRILLQQLSGDGHLIFYWDEVQPNGFLTLDERIFAGTPTSIVQLARHGQLAPDGNGTVQGIGALNGYNDSGQYAYYAELSGMSGARLDQTAVFLNDNGVTTQIARAGMPGPAGTTISAVSRVNSSINESGQIAFEATLVGGPNESALIRYDGAAMTKLAEYGQLSPRGDGTLFRIPGFVFNNAGQAAFIASDVVDPHDINTFREGVFRADGNALYEVARAGDPVPGGNGAFSGFVNGSDAPDSKMPKLNNAGQMAFLSYISGSAGGPADDQALVLSGSDGATLTVVGREGQVAPDGNGRLGFPPSPSTPYISLNDRGQVAYLAAFTGTSGGAAYDGAILLWTGSQTIVVAREGDTLLGSQIIQLSRIQLNNHEQLAFDFLLADGRKGIGLWSIPEPTCISLACCSCAFLGFFQRRQGVQ